MYIWIYKKKKISAFRFFQTDVEPNITKETRILNWKLTFLSKSVFKYSVQHWL